MDHMRERVSKSELKLLELSAKQRRFIEEYSLDHNGAGAAVRAGYSAQSARITASRLLTKANIKAALEAQVVAIESRFQLSRERVVSQLKEAVAVARTQADAKAMIRGWTAIAQICGYHVK